MVVEFSEARPWVANSDVISTPLGDEVALLDHRSNTYFTLNATGAFLWSRLQQRPCSAMELGQALADEFNGSQDEMLDDVRTLVAELHTRDLIVPANDDEP
ncbi:PqqD family protein [Roseitranquillus sediminis]|uniref:PqqD family protein n=1 Tax=Roseitranquillus sediminis TaxID=2809051 RepID=UPI001D0CA4B0|nr:PqqD family protein [Roseitranquillus sediminis]MBM9594023.1 PqqD family protein [Roseitranquillus sediminis]